MKKISLRRKKQTGKSVKGFSTLSLKRDIMREGRVLNRHVGAMELIAEKVSKEVEKWVLERGEVTKADIDRVTAARIRKYDADVAYLYRNRGKIV